MLCESHNSFPKITKKLLLYQKSDKKARVSHLADKTMKKLLDMAEMRAIQLENDLKKYYIRKVAQGKNKIIHRIFAMIKSEKLYDFNLHLS